MSLRSLFFSVFFVLTSAVSSVADVVLVMVEEQGCIWCARWNDEISHIYPKTEEGKAAPLHRIDINAARPEGMIFARALTFTPTFVLMLNGKETSRIEGYPGEDFFWGILERMLEQANVDVSG